MVTIKLKVIGQNLKAINCKKFVAASDTINYFRCYVDFSSDWDKYTSRSIYFKNMSSDVCKAGVFDHDGYCFIPWEVLANTGVIIASAVGIVMDGNDISERLTTFPVTLFVQVEEGQITVQPNEDPSPTQYEQFIANVQSYAESALAAKFDAENSAIRSEASSGSAVSAKLSAIDASNSAKASAAAASSSAVSAAASQESVNEMVANLNSIEGSVVEQANIAVEAANSASSSESFAHASALSAQGYSETSVKKAVESAASAELAKASEQAAKSFAELAQTTESHIKTMTVSVHSLAETEAPTVEKSDTSTGFSLDFGIPKGATGNGISSIDLTSSEGKTDVYTIYFTDGNSTTFEVKNGEDGTGAGDMRKLDYDSNDDGKVNSADVADSVDWSGITNKPTVFTPSSHNHDDMYYTEAEVDEKLLDSGKVKDVQVDGVSVVTDKIANITGLAKETTVSDLLELVPNQASNTNQLADKDFVNSTVGTNTAFFRGTFDSLSELQAYSGELTNNDYAFVVIYDSVVPTEVVAYNRYKYNGSSWVFEYTLNNSSFTMNQWSAINSGITSDQVSLIATALQSEDLAPYRKSADQDVIDSGKSNVGHKHVTTDITDLNSNQIRAVYTSESDPASSDGSDGDVWLKYGAAQPDCPFPIGGVYISIVSTNPSSIWSGTTWEQFAKGKTLVGCDADDSDFSVAGKTGGEKTHTLTTDEIPAHGHGMEHTHSYTGPNTASWKVGTSTAHKWCTSAGSKTSGGASKSTTDNAGGGLEHNNLQPYITVYMWKRVS